MLIGLFERCMKRRGVKECDPYDWEKVDTATATTITCSQSNQINQAQVKNEYVHGNITQMTVVASNASGADYVSFCCCFPKEYYMKCYVLITVTKTKRY